jgi:hypothetical protein
LVLAVVTVAEDVTLLVVVVVDDVRVCVDPNGGGMVVV